MNKTYDSNMRLLFDNIFYIYKASKYIVTLEREGMSRDRERRRVSCGAR